MKVEHSQQQQFIHHAPLEASTQESGRSSRRKEALIKFPLRISAWAGYGYCRQRSGAGVPPAPLLDTRHSTLRIGIVRS